MANSSWKDIEVSEQYQRAGTTLRVFLKQLYRYNEALKRYERSRNEIELANSLLMAISELNNLTDDAQRAFFNPGNKKRRFSSLHKFLVSMDEYYKLNTNITFIDYFMQGNEEEEAQAE